MRIAEYGMSALATLAVAGIAEEARRNALTPEDREREYLAREARRAQAPQVCGCGVVTISGLLCRKCKRTARRNR